MDAPSLSQAPSPKMSEKSVESTPSIVFQPQKLKEVVAVVDLMGTVANRIREDSSGDMGGGGGSGGGTSGQQSGSGTTARDEAIAKAPPVGIMQKELVKHLQDERRAIRHQARAISRSNAPGAAWTLSELYKKMRRLTSLISQIWEASTEMIRRFYVSVFIDRQPLVVTGGSIAQSEK